jgi:hypothetical protein
MRGGQEVCYTYAARSGVGRCAEVDDGGNGGGWPTQMYGAEAWTGQRAMRRMCNGKDEQPALQVVRLRGVGSRQICTRLNVKQRLIMLIININYR